MPIQAVRRTAPENDPSRLLGLHILNVSRGGVAAVAHDSLQEKESLVLFFPPLGSGKGRDTPAQVVRCRRTGECYTVAIAFDEPWPEREEVGRFD